MTRQDLGSPAPLVNTAPLFAGVAISIARGVVQSAAHGAGQDGVTLYAVLTVPLVAAALCAMVLAL